MVFVQKVLKGLFTSGGFRGSVLTLLTGTSIALIAAYFAKPILARLYSPEAFGLADVFVSLVSILVPVASLRYEDALMLPEEEEDAAGILRLSFLLSLIISALSVALIVWRQNISEWLGAPDLAPWLWLVPLTLLIVRAGKLAESWLVRLKQFRPISVAQIARTSVMVSTRIGAGIPAVGAGVGGLIVGFIIGNLASTGLVLNRLGRTRFSFFGSSPSSSLLRIARRYRHFPFFTLPSTFLSALLSRLPFLLLIVFFDKTVVGYFGMAFSALLVPLSLIGMAISQVFFIHAAEAKNPSELSELTSGVYRRLIMIGLFPTIVLLLAGPDIFDVVFSHAWRPAGEYVQRLAPWLFFTALASPLTRLFDVLERQRLDLAISFFMLGFLSLALVIGGRLGNPLQCMLLIGLTGMGVRVAQIGILLHLGTVSLRSMILPFLRYAFYACPAIIGLLIMLNFNNPLMTTLTAASGGVVFGLFVLWRDDILQLKS